MDQSGFFKTVYDMEMQKLTQKYVHSAAVTRQRLGQSWCN